MFHGHVKQEIFIAMLIEAVVASEKERPSIRIWPRMPPLPPSYGSFDRVACDERRNGSVVRDHTQSPSCRALRDRFFIPLISAAGHGPRSLPEDCPR